jgi:acetyl-CoA C-acetyltransferase
MVKQDVAVVGVGLTKMGRRYDSNHSELAWEAIKELFDKTTIWIDDVDAVVYGTMDPFDGIASPERWDSSAYGIARGAGKPLVKVTTGGTTGMSIALSAYYHVASGLYDIVLAVGTQKVTEPVEAQEVLNIAVDPLFDRHTGVGAIAVGAIQASAYYFDYNNKIDEYMAIVASKNRLNALRNPYSHLKLKVTPEEALMAPYLIWPIKLLDSCPSSDGSVAVLMASDKVARKIFDSPAWVSAVDYISDTYWFCCNKGLSFWNSLAILARRLYRKAGISDPKKQIDVFELYDAFTIQEILEYEALGLANKGEGWKLLEEEATYPYGDYPVNPSGGVLSTNPVGVTGLWRFAEAALQVMDNAGAHQVPNVDIALAHAWGGALQFHALALLSRERKLC